MEKKKRKREIERKKKEEIPFLDIFTDFPLNIKHDKFLSSYYQFNCLFLIIIHFYFFFAFSSFINSLVFFEEGFLFQISSFPNGLVEQNVTYFFFSLFLYIQSEKKRGIDPLALKPLSH